MKHLFSIVFLMTVTLASYGQQKPHYTQYILNQYIVNPALSGIESYIDVKASHRHQWVGIQDAPVTSYFSIQGPIGKQDSRVSATGIERGGYNPRGKDYWMEYNAAAPHHGIGLQLIQDVTGPLSRSAAYATYAYHMGLSVRSSLAAGFGIGMTKLSLNASKLQFYQQADPSVYQNTIGDKWKPDVNAGVYYYSADYFIGVSAQQIIPQKIEFTNNQLRKEDGKLVPHIFMTAGYRFLLGENFNLMPSVMVKYISPLPTQFDLNMKLQYLDAFWVGGSYRHKDGFAGMVGMNIGSTFNVGYSYDYTTSQLSNYSKGTHEILVGFLLGNRYGDSCPRNVW
jgi:type IX secretion system PorP/SprF family membrane protein